MTLKVFHSIAAKLDTLVTNTNENPLFYVAQDRSK